MTGLTFVRLKRGDILHKEKLTVVGLTGQTGAGKTTVSKIFEEMGFAVINADKIARDVVTPKLLEKLVLVFGKEILNDDNTLNRKVLAAKTFSDSEELFKLGEIMYPPILEKIENQINTLKDAGITKILLDAPTLFESGAYKFCNCKISVLANEELRKERIIKRDSLTPDEAKLRMSAQKNDRYYVLRSDYIIKNNSSEEEVKSQTKLIAKRLNSKDKKSLTPLTNLILWAVIVATAILFITNIYRFALHAIYPQKYETLITEYSENYSVDKDLIFAVIKCESNFKPNAVSKADAKGLMQITEETFDWINLKLGRNTSYSEIFDPEINIQYGTYLISTLLAEFGTEQNALAAYHAGWGNVKKWLNDERYSSNGVTLDNIPFPTTDGYVNNVLNSKEIYENLYS